MVRDRPQLLAPPPPPPTAIARSSQPARLTRYNYSGLSSARVGGAEKSKSSVPLQMLLYYNAYYSPCYVLLSLLIFIYKGERLRRPRPLPAALPRQPLTARPRGAQGASCRTRMERLGGRWRYWPRTRSSSRRGYSRVRPTCPRDAAAALHHDCSRAPQG